MGRIKYYRYFANLIKPHEKWLNKMGSSGHNLVKTGMMKYEFEVNPNTEYEYRVIYVGNKSYKNLKTFKSILDAKGYTTFYKNINLNYSTFKVQIRPWAEKGGRIATTNTTINKELLIICKIKDGTPFKLY